MQKLHVCPSFFYTFIQYKGKTYKSPGVVDGQRTLKFRLIQKESSGFAVITEYNLLFNLQWVYSQILRVGKLLFAA